MLWQARLGLVAPNIAALSPSAGGGGGGGTARQVTVYSPAFGLISIDSGSTVRQTTLPGVAVNEGT